MIGNDVIDLRDPDAQPESFRSRFDERVFSPVERAAISRDPIPLARRWAHWGAKEAAYKLAKQSDSGYVFSPRALVAEFDGDESRGFHAGAPRERRGRLEFPKALPNGITTLELRSFENAERVHVVAVPLGSDWGAVDLAVESLEPGSTEPSIGARRLATREIGRSLGVEERRISIGRNDRIPTVELDGEPTSVSLSLSHHGHWVAYAMRIQVELPRSSVSKSAWIAMPERIVGRI
jgi:hypothetical protein